MKISAPNDGQVFWNSQTLIERSTHCSYRKRIVKAEDPVGSGLATQEPAHRFCAVLSAVDIYFPLSDDVIINNFQASFGQPSLVSFEPL